MSDSLEGRSGDDRQASQGVHAEIMNLTELKHQVEDKAVEYLNTGRLEALEETALNQLNKSANNGYVRLHKLEFSALLNAVRGLQRKCQNLEAVAYHYCGSLYNAAEEE